MTYKLDIIKHRKTYLLIALAVLAISVISLLVQGLNLGIDFKSGTRLDISVTPNASIEKARQALESMGFDNPNVRIGGQNNQVVIFRVDKPMSQPDIQKIKAKFQETFKVTPKVQEQKVDPIIGRELARNAIMATVIASLFIVVYVAFRFEWRFGVAAVFALVYDAMFTIGMFSLLRLEVDVVFIAAILTIVGYSINDTIVIFDRIRENLDTMKPKKWEDLANVVNVSINQTLNRSINTVLTVVFAAFALWLLGGESISNFSLALLFGLVSGAYSSIFVASPLWIGWKWKAMQKEKQESVAAD
ncbi:protein translocase subunit SecF [Laceyella putida]|uniref:Protein-export membrane protein SecF n=1 Tax=Laceyella putida TaxID=110101 RepID=A0ABW2RIW0_9BACL